MGTIAELNACKDASSCRESATCMMHGREEERKRGRFHENIEEEVVFADAIDETAALRLYSQAPGVFIGGVICRKTSGES